MMGMTICSCGASWMMPRSRRSDILGGGFGRRLVVDESERVGNLAVAEQYGQRMLGITDAIGLIERGLPVPWAAAHSQGAREDAFVRGKPAKAGLMDKREHLRDKPTLLMATTRSEAGRMFRR